MSDNILEVGDEILPFNGTSQVGVIRYREYIDSKWCLLVSVNKCFDPVATTEIGCLSKLSDEFEARNLCVLILCADTGLKKKMIFVNIMII